MSRFDLFMEHFYNATQDFRGRGLTVRKIGEIFMSLVPAMLESYDTWFTIVGALSMHRLEDTVAYLVDVERLETQWSRTYRLSH